MEPSPTATAVACSPSYQPQLEPRDEVGKSEASVEGEIVIGHGGGARGDWRQRLRPTKPQPDCMGVWRIRPDMSREREYSHQAAAATCFH